MSDYDYIVNPSKPRRSEDQIRRDAKRKAKRSSLLLLRRLNGGRPMKLDFKVEPPA